MTGARDATLRSLDALVGAELLPRAEAPALRGVEARYSIAVPPQMAALIDRADPNDPIARQFLPDARELDTTPAELGDPIGDDAHSPVPGLVHRYRDRVLLKLVAVCPVYCRFCFRRETVGKSGALDAAAVATALDYVAAHEEIFEVILTGGDPLAASPRRLREVATRLSAISHVKLLRVHTRAPTAAPELVSQERLDALQAAGKRLYVALHVNHPRELFADAREALAKLQGAGAQLLSQTVLLSGVNDDVATLETLMRTLVELGIKPYYLHHPDLAKGTAHFRLPLARGREIYAALAQNLSGHALPRYVLDLPGGFGKIPVEGPHLEAMPGGGWSARDRFGTRRVYKDDAGRAQMPA